MNLREFGGNHYEYYIQIISTDKNAHAIRIHTNDANLLLPAICGCQIYYLLKYSQTNYLGQLFGSPPIHNDYNKIDIKTLYITNQSLCT